MRATAVRCGRVSAFDPDDLNRAVATLVWLAAVACGVLAATGLILMVAYDPDGLGWLSALHSLASALLLGCAAGAVACAAAAALKRSRTWTGWPLTLAGLGVAVVGVGSGQLVRWTAVSPEDLDARGVFGPLGGAVEAIEVGGAEVSRTTFAAWVVVHVVVVTALALLVGWSLRRRRQEWAAGAAVGVEESSQAAAGVEGAPTAGPAAGADPPADSGREPPTP